MKRFLLLLFTVCLTLVAGAETKTVDIDASNIDMTYDGDKGTITGNSGNINSIQPLRSITHEDVVLTFTNEGGNNPAWWNYYDTSKTPEIRVYKKNTLTVTVPEGATLASVAITMAATFSGTETGTLNIEASFGSFSPNSGSVSTSKDLTWSAGETASNQVTFTLSATLKFKKATIIYETKPALGTPSAKIGGNTLEIIDVDGKDYMAEASVPAESNLEVSCDGATTVTLKYGETVKKTENSNSLTYPITFPKEELNDKGVLNYIVVFSDGTNTKTLDLTLKELGSVVVQDENDNALTSGATLDYGAVMLVTATNAETVTVTAEGVNETVTIDNSGLGLYTFNHPGMANYTFTAKNGQFSTSTTFQNITVNPSTEKPLKAKVTIGGTTYNTDTDAPISVLLNSTATVSAENADSYEMKYGEEPYVNVENGTFTVAKSGKYTIRGINSAITTEDKYGDPITLTITVTLGNPQIKVGGQAVEDPAAITLPMGGGEIELVALDAKDNNAVNSFDYTVGDVTKQDNSGCKLPVTESGTYTFTVYSADKAASATITATITIAKAEVFVRATNVNELSDGDKVIIVCEDNGYAASKEPSTEYAKIVNAGIDQSGKWIYDDTKNVGVFELKRTGDNQYAFHIGDNWLFAGGTEDKKTGLSSATQIEDKHKFNVSFNDNNNNVNLSSVAVPARMLYFYLTTTKSDIRNYLNHANDSHYIQLYVLQKSPEAPTLTVKGESVTDFSKQIEVKVGDVAVFSSKDATSMVVNDAEYSAENGSYTITFAEDMFTNNEYIVKVKGKNETGESDAVSVTFKLNPAPAAPVVKVNGELVQGDAVTVQPGDVMSVEVPEGVSVVCTKTKDGVETALDANKFPYTFSPEDYILAEGKVSATPVTYTFKAKKGEYVSEVVTLNVTVEEPLIANGIYRHVTSNDEIQEGKKYVIACHGTYFDKTANKVMSNVEKKDNRAATELSLNQDGTLTPDNKTLILSFEKVEGQENQWYIKTDNYAVNPGTTYYFQEDKTASNGLKISDDKSTAAKYTIEFVEDVNSVNGVDVKLKSTKDGKEYYICFNALQTTPIFSQYKYYNTQSNYCPVQLYVLEGDEMVAGTYDEFVNVSTLHPGQEVKFVKPLTIKANYGNKLWMVDETGKAVYAEYDEAKFTDYLMDALNRFNRKFWNFSGVAVKDTKVADEALMYVEITSIDVDYELSTENGDSRTGKAPYTEDMEDLNDPSMKVPLFDYDDLVWWSFGQIYGNIETDSNGTTIKKLNSDGTETDTAIPVLTDLPPAGPTVSNNSSAISYLRYETAEGIEGIEWLAGSGGTYFSPNSKHDNQYIVGAIMPDASGKKAIAAMAVSGKQISTGVESVDADDAEAIVDVYNMQGMRLRSGVRRADALRDLPAGIYIVGGKKVLVTQ